jgi:hypothetical protein
MFFSPNSTYQVVYTSLQFFKLSVDAIQLFLAIPYGIRHPITGRLGYHNHLLAHRVVESHL